MKIKVLFFLSTLESSGPTSVVYNIIKYLNRNIIDPCILTLSPESSNSRINAFKELDVRIFSFGRGRLNWLFPKNSITEIVNAIMPDVIHSHSLRPDITSSKHLGGFVRICTIHGNLEKAYRDSYNFILGTLLAKSQISSLKHMDQVVACSKSVYEIYKNRVSKFTVIPNGVDTNIFYRLTPDEKNRKREALSLPKEKRIFISAGSLIKLKDPYTVIDAFLSSSIKNDSVLIILGKGPLENKLKFIYRNNKNLLFLGFKNNIVEYFQASDFFISASSSEGLPNSPIEALACGLPILLSNIAPHREIIELHHAAGRLFSLYNTADLTAKIEEISKESYELCSQAAFNLATVNFSAEKMAQNYQDLYINFQKK